MREEMGGARGSERIATVLFVTLVCLNFLSACMAQMNTAGSPTLVVGMGGSGAYGGFLVLVFVIASMVSRLVAGVVADNRSRRVLLVSGCIVYIIGCALPILFPVMAALVPARILQGWGYASVNTAATTCASDVLPASRLGEGIGYYGLGHAVAMALGPMLGLALAGTHAMAPLALGALALSVIALLLSLTVVYERDPSRLPESCGYVRASSSRAEKPERVRISASAAFDASGLRGGVPMFLISGVITFYLSFAPLFAQSMGYANASALFAFAAVAAVFVRFVAAKAFDRYSPLAVFLVPVAFGVLSLGAMYFIRTEAVFLACGACYGVCLGFSIPLLNSVVVKAALPERYGAANALFLLCYDAGVGLAAVAWGAVYDLLGFEALFVVSALTGVLAFISACVLFPRRRRR